MNDYLEGYGLFAKYGIAWTGGACDIMSAKCAIANAKYHWPKLETGKPPYWSEDKSRGWVDAALDSVGC